MKQTCLFTISLASIGSLFSMENPLVHEDDVLSPYKHTIENQESNVIKSKKPRISDEHLEINEISHLASKKITKIEQTIETVLKRKKILEKQNDNNLVSSINNYDNWLCDLRNLKSSVIEDPSVNLDNELRKILKKYDPIAFASR